MRTNGNARQLYLACYDITNQRRRAVALKLIRCYATGGQRSVHELYMTHAERETLVKDMRALLEATEDRFQLVALDPRSKVFALGKAVRSTAPECFYVS